MSSIKSKFYEHFFKGISSIFGDKNGYVKFSILRGPAKGLQFKFDFTRPIEKAYVLGSYDTHDVALLNKLCHDGWVIWDCGTYLGFYTAYFARLVGNAGQVVAFEPDPRNMLRTQENVQLNGYDNVQYQSVAVGSPAEKITLVLGESTNSHLPGMYIGATEENYAKSSGVEEGAIEVRCISLDQAYENPEIPNPDLIKIDIEGAEKEALQHISKLMTDVRPILLLELHNPECDAVAWEFSQAYNYTLMQVHNNRIVRKKEDTEGTLLCTPN